MSNGSCIIVEVVGLLILRTKWLGNQTSTKETDTILMSYVLVAGR
jgi:hypothetical protein